MARRIMLQTQCSQCGATAFDRRDDGFIVCTYCYSVYKLQSDPNESKIVIKKGANVVVGKTANITIRGGVEIEAGANVLVDGKIEIIEAASAEAIAMAKAKLQKVKN
ncbi:MAG: TFIIB-type zinc finger domain-containing protein [Arenimonas sp.]